MNTLRTALDFARNTLDINGSARDGLIFDLQNTADVLENNGQKLSYLRGQCEALIESNVWNAAELQGLLSTGEASIFAYHGALRRSLQQKF